MITSQDKPNAAYSKQYDAYYDSVTGEWLEKGCIDPECPYCVGRPPTAFQTELKDTSKEG